MLVGHNAFYHSLLRKYVILVGTIFNDIYITRENEGETTAKIRVPITYGPKEKTLARVMQDASIDRTTATTPLPVMSFEIGQMKYDGSRKLLTKKRVAVRSTDSDESFNYQYTPVPYNINFKVYIYAKFVEDANKIVEQILPYFTPDWTQRVTLIEEMNEIKDIPIILNDIYFEDKYTGNYDKRQTVIWTLDLTLKGYFYGPVKESKIIKFVKLNFRIPNGIEDGDLQDAVGNTPIAERLTVQPGLTANGVPVNYYGGANNDLGTIPYREISEDDDYGYITFIYNTDELTDESE